MAQLLMTYQGATYDTSPSQVGGKGEKENEEPLLTEMSRKKKEEVFIRHEVCVIFNEP